MKWSGMPDSPKLEFHGLWCRTITRNSGLHLRVFGDEVKWPLKECAFCEGQNSVQLHRFEVLNQIKTFPSANFGSIWVFQKLLMKGHWFLGKTTAEDLITWDHQDSWLFTSLLIYPSTLSPCFPNAHQMLAPVCKVCTYLVVLLIYLYLPVERYPKTWGPGEPAHYKEK